ncbi:MAG: phosphoribosylformylglycinamidine synthase subunit PurS [bacterium]
MAIKFEVMLKPEIKNPASEKIQKRIYEDLKIKNVSEIKIIEIYTIDKDLKKEILDKIQNELLVDSIIQIASYNKPLANNFDWLIEVSFKPGVTDNIGKTTKEAIKDISGEEINCYTSKQYLFKGNLKEEKIKTIGSKLLANDLIENWQFTNFANFEKNMKIILPTVSIKQEIKIAEIDLNISDEELLNISKKGILALSLKEMQQIKNYFKNSKIIEERQKIGLGEKILDAELEILAQTWSEHCKHKIFNSFITYEEDGKIIEIDSLFKTYIKKSTDEIGEKIDWLVSVFHDNAGVVKFNENWNIAFKVETHNAPSALDPYGGALTGIVGVNRDSFGTGKGAKLIFNTNVFCFASPFYQEEIPPRLLHPKRVFEGVRLGVEHGGNKSGIPTVNGCIVFDDRFLGKPLVYCGTGSIMPNSLFGEGTHLKTAYPEDLIIMIGGRIGKDGIHGATFSSEELNEDSPVSAVQIGDPITQKKMFDFLLEARNLGLYHCITDNGAGGLASSIGEMACFSNGCEIYLDKCPLKYSGLEPWEILLSESQERMSLVIKIENKDAFLLLAKKRDVEATVIGKFTNSGKFIAKYKDQYAVFLNMEFLHNGLPKMQLEAKWQKPNYAEPIIKEEKNLTTLLKEILARLNVCSKENIIRQYDHEVQGTSVIKPLTGINNDGPSDASIIKPIFDSFEGIVISNGICSKYGDIDTYHMTGCAIDEAIRNIVAVGGDPDRIALLDNFCWCDPIVSEKNLDGKYKLAQLVRSNQALYDYAICFNTPFISGKDSMKNDYQIGNIKISIPPTILISAIGKIENVTLAITMDVKNEEDLVYILGETFNELGGSEYFNHINYIGNNVPKVNALKAKKLYQDLHKAINQKLVKSCHDISDGGLGVALSEISFAGGLGMEINLSKVPISKIENDITILFSETPSRFVVTISNNNKEEFEKILSENIIAEIGKVNNSNELVIKGLKENILIKANIWDLKESWQNTLKW